MLVVITHVAFILDIGWLLMLQNEIQIFKLSHFLGRTKTFVLTLFTAKFNIWLVCAILLTKAGFLFFQAYLSTDSVTGAGDFEGIFYGSANWNSKNFYQLNNVGPQSAWCAYLLRLNARLTWRVFVIKALFILHILFVSFSSQWFQVLDSMFRHTVKRKWSKFTFFKHLLLLRDRDWKKTGQNVE